MVNVNQYDFKMMYSGNKYNLMKLMSGEQSFSLADHFNVFVISLKNLIGKASDRELQNKELYDQASAISGYTTQFLRGVELYKSIEVIKFGSEMKGTNKYKELNQSMPEGIAGCDLGNIFHNFSIYMKQWQKN